MNSLKPDKQTEAFETLLLSYVDMCYAVALALTHNHADAKDLTLEVLEWAWQIRNREDAAKSIKKTLLAAMRQQFIENYRKPLWTQKQHAAIAERV